MGANIVHVHLLGNVAHGAVNPTRVDQHQGAVGSEAVVGDRCAQVDVRQLVRPEHAQRGGGGQRVHLLARGVVNLGPQALVQHDGRGPHRRLEQLDVLAEDSHAGAARHDLWQRRARNSALEASGESVDLGAAVVGVDGHG